MDWPFAIFALLKILGVIFVVILPMVSYTVYAERRVSALIQDRIGPNRVGMPLSLLGFKKDLILPLGGLGQPIADAVKFLLKEDFTPAHVNKFYFWLAPGLAMAPAILTMAVVPFGSTILGVPMVIANINIGVLFVFGVASLGVYGIVLAGWSSNSKYPFLGSVRSTSQMISYELSLGLSVIPLFLVMGELNLPKIVEYQIAHGWTILPFTNLPHFLPGAFHHRARNLAHFVAWRQVLLWIPMLISFFVFTVSIFAETNRLPFDLPEAETELVAGYHTEYSSMKFALFFLGEYAAMITGCSLIVTLFLGGWHVPFIPDGSGPGIFGAFWGLVNIACFFGKVALLLFVFIWVRWTLPRFRYDQLMRLGWVFFFEIALVNILITAIILAVFPQ
jgi:NADH-quinone oxidoreductase subunit H